MKYGDQLRYWIWEGTRYLKLKPGVMPMAFDVYYCISERKFLASSENVTRKKIHPERIDQRAVAEALAVSLTYVEGI